MLKFRHITVKDKLIIDSFFAASNEISCEANFATLMIWQTVYGTEFCIEDDVLLIRMKGISVPAYSLPFGNFERGVELIFAENPSPRFWIQEGERCDKFIKAYGDKYEICESRDAFDYLYLRSDLAELSGKKYQSKRNHISAFTRAHSWHYEPIAQDNIAAVKACADEWYADSGVNDDKYLSAEREGINLLLDNMDMLGVRGGAVFTDGKVVAFTLGSPINGEIFNTHIEKALPDYSTAYAVINREFARSLSGYTYINREDDMGLEGLRKAKLSYRPIRLIRKFRCDMVPTVREQCFAIYRAAFGNFGEFDERLFDLFFSYCRYIKSNNEVAAMLFALPCTLVLDGERYPCSYIYAAATAEKFRSQGYMTRLLKMLSGTLLLKPASESLVNFYAERGFSVVPAVYRRMGERRVEVSDDYAALAYGGVDNGGEFTAMIKSDLPLNTDGICFAYTME